MTLGCTIAGHKAAADAVYNSGYYFSACRRCGRSLVRSAAGAWGPVPPGHRVIWKAGRHSHSLEADYTGVLPIVQDEPALPRSRSPALAAGRSLIRMRPSWSAAAGGSGPAEENGDYQYPRLLLLAVLLGAGVKMLLGLASGR
ncbi:MAG TPA: hypothetical protein VN231_15020 [Allosphingosinicella sp.]|nr:hypothetical protein [Allosphingosinicella sp.]